MILRTLLVIGLSAGSSACTGLKGGTGFEKIRLRLDIARIDDPVLKELATEAQNDISDAIGTLSHPALSSEEIAKKIGYTGSERLLLAPESACVLGVGLITPQGRTIIRQSYAFMSATDWKSERDHSLSFSANYQDAVVQENITKHRYYFKDFNGRWVLIRQEIIGRNIRRVKCPGSSNLAV